MRRLANAQAASEAAARGEPYVASPVLFADGSKQHEANSGAWGGLGAGAPLKTAQGASSPAANLYTQSASAPPAQPQSPIDVKSIAAGMTAEKGGDISSQINVVLGVANTDGTERRRQLVTGYYPLPSTKQEVTPGPAANGPGGAASNMAAATTNGAASGATSSARSVLPGWTAGTGFYCRVPYGLNSDLARRDVLGKCIGGPADGATFIGTAEPSPEGVANPAFTLLFKKVQIPGKGTFSVNAVGIDNETMELAAQDDVNDHAVAKFSLLGVAGLLKGLGQAASIVTGYSNTQTVGNVSNTTVSVQRPDIRQQIGMAAGGVGTSIGEYTQKKAEALKTTIKIYPGKDLGIVLLDDVIDQKN